MIFTPEESREIAVEMLKWDRIPGYAHDVWHECWFDSAGRFVSVSLPDFSQPEWTGAMLEAVHKVCNKRRWANVGIRKLTIDAYRPRKGSRCGIFNNENLNRNLYDAWRWLTNKEASDVQS